MTKRLFITTSGGKTLGQWEHQLGNTAILISTIKGLRELANLNFEIVKEMVDLKKEERHHIPKDL